MKISEIETSRVDGDDGWRDWLVIAVDPIDGGVAFHTEYVTHPGAERQTWLDGGIAFDDRHLDDVILALLRVRLLRSAQSRTRGAA